VEATAGIAAKPRRSVRGGLELFAVAAVLAAALALTALGMLRITGHSLLVDRGDLLITRTVEASTLRPGDVVTFADPTRAGRKVTQRVASVSGNAQLELVTGEGEDWSVASDGTVGEVRATVPSAGRALEWLDWRMLLVVLPPLMLAAFALRRIRAS
jgi:hypothetical protein